MTTVSVEDARAQLAELIRQLTHGDEVVITQDNRPVARLVPAGGAAQRKLGTLKGIVTYMAPDFDAPLPDFKDYMP